MVLSLFIILDPPGIIPVVIRLFEGLNRKEQLKISLYVTVFVAILLLLFTILGEAILRYFGISFAALKIAGGILIGLVGFEMTRAGEKPKHRKEELVGFEEALSNMLVPVGSPLLVGPGAISLSIINGAVYGYPISILGAIIAAILVFPFIYFSTLIGKIIGERGVRILTRILGFFILAIGIQYILDGVVIFKSSI